MIKQNLEKSLVVWGKPFVDSDFQEMAQRLTNCEKLTTSFLDGKLSFEAYLDLMQSQGVDMDSYEESVRSNLEYFGFV